MNRRICLSYKRLRDSWELYVQSLGRALKALGVKPFSNSLFGLRRVTGSDFFGPIYYSKGIIPTLSG
jgi:hypothetical protein